MEDKVSLYNFTWKYNLHCASQLTISSFGMLFFCGFALGALLIPGKSDIYGRKPIFMGSMIVQLMVMVGIMLVPVGPVGNEAKYINYLVFLFFVFGMASSGRTSVGYVYMCEFAPERYHNIMGTLWCVGEGTIYIYLTIYYYFFGKIWEVPNYFGIFLTVLTTLGASQLPESPKFLYNKQMYESCHTALTRMLLFNLGTSSSLKIDELLTKQEQTSKDQSRSGSLLPHLQNLICMTMIWASSSFCYYLISYQLKYIKGNIFVNGMISSTSEIIAYIVSSFVLRQFGIRNTFLISFAISLIGMVAITQTTNEVLLACFILTCKFGISQAFNVAYIGNLMLFPTDVVTSSFGICNIFARISTILAPFVAEIKPEMISYQVFNVVVFVAMIASYCIKK
jgi:MFS family permease